MTELEIKEYIKKFAKETGKSVENLELIKKEDLIDNVTYYGISPKKEKNKYSDYHGKYIREAIYDEKSDCFEYWEGSKHIKISYKEFLPVGDINERKNLEKLRHLWETGKINSIYQEVEDGDSCEPSYTYYPDLDITMKCDNFFEGCFNDSMIEANPELYKGRLDFDTILTEMELVDMPDFVKSLVSEFPDEETKSTQKDKKFRINRRVFGNRCYFNLSTKISVADLVSECETEDEIEDYISDIFSCCEPELDESASYWHEDVLSEDVPMDEILEAYRKAKSK